MPGSLQLGLGIQCAQGFPSFDPLSLNPILAFEARTSMLADSGGAAGNLDLVATLENRVSGGANATQTTSTRQPRAHVPVGGGHLYLPAVTGNVPFCDAGSMTNPSDFLDIRVTTADTRADMTANNGRFVSKDNSSSNRLFYFMLKSDNKLFFPFWDTGGTLRIVTSTSATAAAANGYRVVFRSVDNEDSSKLSVTFFESSDEGQTWSQLGDKYTANGNHVLKQSSSTDYFFGGVNNSSSSHLINPLLKQVEIYLGDNETNQILDINFAKAEHGASSFTPDIGGQVSINTSGNDPATIIRRPVVRFDGASSSGDHMIGSLSSLINTAHCFIKFATNQASLSVSSAGILSVYQQGYHDWETRGVRLFTGYTNQSLRSYYGLNWRLIQNGIYKPENGTMVAEGSFTDGAQFRKTNNASLLTDSLSLSVFSSNRVIIGDVSNLGFAAGIDIEQIYLFDRVLSADEQEKIRDYMNPSDSIYRRITDSDALAYIAALEGDGVSVSRAQKEAIEDFYVTAKSGGWYSSLKRLYLPIWEAAAPNARCLVSSTSGTFEGSFTFAAGYSHPDAASASNRFDTGYKLLDDLTIENACLMALAYDDTSPHDRGINNSNKTIIGAGGITANSVRINTSGSALLPKASWLGVDVTGSLPTFGSHGVLLSNRKDGDTTLSRRTASAFDEKTSTGTLTGTYNNSFPITGFGSAASSTGSAAQPTDSNAGAFGISDGLNATDRASYTDAVKTLWETCSGITL